MGTADLNRSRQVRSLSFTLFAAADAGRPPAGNEARAELSTPVVETNLFPHLNLSVKAHLFLPPVRGVELR